MCKMISKEGEKIREQLVENLSQYKAHNPIDYAPLLRMLLTEIEVELAEQNNEHMERIDNRRVRTIDDFRGMSDFLLKRLEDVYESHKTREIRTQSLIDSELVLIKRVIEERDGQ